MPGNLPPTRAVIHNAGKAPADTAPVLAKWPLAQTPGGRAVSQREDQQQAWWPTGKPRSHGTRQIAACVFSRKQPHAHDRNDADVTRRASFIGRDPPGPHECSLPMGTQNARFCRQACVLRWVTAG